MVCQYAIVQLQAIGNVLWPVIIQRRWIYISILFSFQREANEIKWPLHLYTAKAEGKLMLLSGLRPTVRLAAPRTLDV